MYIPFHIVDVFADRPLTGNPLAIVPHAEELDDLAMQQIAREFNQAETTFLLPATREGGLSQPRGGSLTPMTSLR